MPCCYISLVPVERGSETIGTVQTVFDKVINSLPYFHCVHLYQKGIVSTQPGSLHPTALNITCMYT